MILKLVVVSMHYTLITRSCFKIVCERKHHSNRTANDSLFSRFKYLLGNLLAAYSTLFGSTVYHRLKSLIPFSGS